jgi:hypothetical protein
VRFGGETQPPSPSEQEARSEPAEQRESAEEAQVAMDGAQSRADQLSLPTEESAIVERLAGYKGVGRKSAEAMVQAFGPDAVFRVLQEQPDRVRQMLGGRRAEQLLRGWQQDHAALTGAEQGSKTSTGRKRKTAKAESGGDGGRARPRKRSRAGSRSRKEGD